MLLLRAAFSPSPGLMCTCCAAPVVIGLCEQRLGWIIAFAVRRTLFVIPTAGEAPIVQAMVALGIGAGPAGTLLMTLPPIGLPSPAMVAPVLRVRVLFYVTAAVLGFGVAGGLLAVWLHL